jgi:Rrf2 family protein
MKLTKRGEYALRAMMALARSPGFSMTTNQISVAQEIPKKFLEQILLSLKAAQLVISRAGPKGGYELVKAPSEIAVGSILQAVEEPISQSVYEPTKSFGTTTQNRVETLLGDIRQYVRSRLESVSLAELAAEELAPEEVEALMWYI